MARILIVDESADDKILCKFALERMGHQVSEASGIESAVQLLRSTPHDLVIHGCNPSQPASGKFTEALQKAGLDVPLILFFGIDPILLRQKEFGDGVTLLSKDVLTSMPGRREEFSAAIEQALKTRLPAQPRRPDRPIGGV